ncbi:NAD(P)-dependent dehydrogenase (short-subunit alcohol dehydrogenase family) [Kineococcus radiotolerans]|uniref:NAD(P)-dependent dehydrogenase (Short-subunit alcohol dehydrogenase family) n=1 Tax=Kineococcus radiotolerans TaxID=131568 RepID=A0A7W4TQZ5_KINRA|nr:SDR family oxidoreductase [Kineococcus radiotolerans]MBB2903503.1 NAD(P)-dependent dehydrogenase (short-subunit alcohol dehydrogenase family) [Kineococcus radiotolerans]
MTDAATAPAGDLAALTASPSTRGVVVVTGGSGGLGREIVRHLARAGWDVAVLSRGREALAATVADVAATGRRGLGVVCDVSEHEQVEAAADEVEEVLGPIAVWVNDAMTSVFAKFVETDPEDFERATRVTYFGFVNGTRAALRRMRPRGAGHVVQIGSALSYRGIPLQSAYCGSKHAVVGFTESVITELLHEGSPVKVSMVHMPGMNTTQFGWVRTRLPQHPQPVAPIYQPDVCARVVVSVVDRPRRSTWVGEPTVGTILGNRLVAPLLDRYLAKTGVDGQQTDLDRSVMTGDALWEPVPGDHGSHGIFDDSSWRTSPQVWAQLHRRPLEVAALAGAGIGAAALALRRRR